MKQVAEWTMKYWVILAALGSATVAIGAGYQKIETMEQAIKAQAETQQQIVKIKEVQSRLDERTLMILQELRAQR